MRFASGFRISRSRKLNKDGVEATGTRCVPEVPEGLIIAESPTKADLLLVEPRSQSL